MADPNLTTLSSSDIDKNKTTELPDLSPLQTIIIVKHCCSTNVTRLWYNYISIAMEYRKIKIDLIVERK